MTQKIDQCSIFSNNENLNFVLKNVPSIYDTLYIIYYSSKNLTKYTLSQFRRIGGFHILD